MADKTREFAEQLRKAPSDPFCERVVRHMVMNVAKDCAMPLLIQLGQCILDYRLAEIRDEVARN